jgi:hypothetical protein
MAVTTFNIVDSRVRPFYELQNIFRYHGYVCNSHYFSIYFRTEENLGKKWIFIRNHVRNSKITDNFRIILPKGTLFRFIVFCASRPL